VLRDALRELGGEPRMTIRDIPAPGEEPDRAAIRARWQATQRAWLRMEDPPEPPDLDEPDQPEGQGGEVA
jgi:hypothetical protein